MTRKNYFKLVASILVMCMMLGGFSVGFAANAQDESFVAKEFITRAEFVTMAVAALEVEGGGDHSFADVPDGAYYKDALNKAVDRGIINGKSTGVFAPDDTLTHQEAATILVKALEDYFGKKLSTSDALKKYTDGNKVEAWATEIMDKAATFKIIPVDKSKMLKPLDGVTKGEAAQLIDNLFDEVERAGEDNFETETKFIQTVAGNVYLRSEKIDIGVSTGIRLLGFEVRGYYGDIIKKGYVKTEKGKANLNFDDLDLGHYSLKVFATDESGIKHNLAETFFGIIEDYDFMKVLYSESPFGINTSYYKPYEGWDPNATAEMIYRMGARNIRDGVGWRTTEPKKGQYVVFQPETIEIFKKYGMTQLFAAGYSNDLYDNGGTPWTKEGLDAFAKYIKALYDLHDGYVQYVDVYNEYWAPTFGDSGGSKSEADCLPVNYYNMVRDTWNAVKPSYPDSMLGIVVGNSTTYKAWTEEFFGYGGLKYGDYIQYHTYTKTPEKDITADVKFLNETMEKYGKKLPIWLDETGHHTASEAQGITTREQGNLVPRLNVVAFAGGVEKVYIYNFMNNGLMTVDNEDNFGLVYNLESEYGAYVPKEGYVTYANMTRQLTDVRFKEDKSQGDVIHYVFANKDRQVDVLYSLKETPVTLLTKKPVKVTDIVGKVNTYEPLNGKVYLDLCSDVLYVEGDFELVNEAIPMDITVKNAVIGTKTKMDFDAKGELAGADITGRVDNNTFKVANNYTFNAPSEVRTNDYIIELEKGGKPFARLRSVVEFGSMFQIDVETEFNATKEKVEGTINLTVTNNSDSAVNIEGVKYKMAEFEGVYKVTEAIPAQKTTVLKFALPEVIPGKMYDVELHLIRGGELSQTADYVGNYHYNRMYEGKMIVGATTEADKANALHVQPNAFTRYYVGDENSIDSDVWISYDDNYLYVRTEVKDDVQRNNNAERNIWNGDCMQIDFTNERYRFDTQPKVYWEYGFALTPNGKSGWVWTATNGKSNTSVENASPGTKYNVLRNEARKLTTYEIQIPWEDVAPITKPTADDALCMTIVFNEGDTSAREGWTTWGLGVAESKNPAKYNVLEVVD